MGRLICMTLVLLIVFSLAEQGDAIYCGRGTGLRQYASSCKECPKKHMGYSVKRTCGGNCRYDERLQRCVMKGIK